MASLLAGRVLAASLVALLLPVALAGLELIERGQRPDIAAAWDAWLRGVMAVGVVVPLVAVAIAVVGMQLSREWMALEQLGHSTLKLLAPMVFVGAGLGFGLGAVVQLAPPPALYDVTAPRPALDGDGVWSWPGPDGRVLVVEPDAMRVQVQPAHAAVASGVTWADARRTWLPAHALLVLVVGVGWLVASTRRIRESARLVTAALVRVVGAAGGFVVAEVILGLFAQSGAIAPWTAVVVLDAGLLALGVAVLIWSSHRRRRGTQPEG